MLTEKYTQKEMWAFALIAGLIVGVICFFWQRYAEKKEAEKMTRLWKTGATRLLGKVWGISNNPQPGMPVIGDSPRLNRAKMTAHFDQADKADQMFEFEVCGEQVSVVLQYPNILHGAVEKQETLHAITEAHDMMSDHGQQMFVGTYPLILDISVTQLDGV